MSKPKVYLAGPISFRDSWHPYVKFHLNEVGILGISPILRMRESDKNSATIKQNRFRMMSCDIVLFNFLGVGSYMTYVELGWADAFQKPSIVVLPPDDVKEVAEEICGWRTNSIDDAIRIIGETLLS